MSAEFIPPEIKNPFHSGREAFTVACTNCARKFHPWHGATASYCSPQCAGRGRTLRLHSARPERPGASKPRKHLIASAEEVTELLDRFVTGDWYGNDEEDDR